MRAWACVLALLAPGCASTVDQVISHALRTPIGEATYTPASGSRHASALARLERRLEALGVSVFYVRFDETPSPWGRAHGLVRVIEIDETLTPDGRLEVLAHEAGHLFQPPSLTPVEAQVFAEFVGAEVCARLGYDIAATSGRYLGQFKHALAGIRATRVDREAAVRLLTEAGP